MPVIDEITGIIMSPPLFFHKEKSCYAQHHLQA
jgi:hypothetical protein